MAGKNYLKKMGSRSFDNIQACFMWVEHHMESVKAQLKLKPPDVRRLFSQATRLHTCEASFYI